MIERRDLAPAPLEVRGFDGIRLRAWDYGSDGPPLLLCHCAGTFGRIWEPIIRRLSFQARVIALDLRGHGDSEQPSGAQHYRWESYGGDVLTAAESLGLGGNALAVGHSGGAAAIALAQLARPGLFRKIALIEAILAPKQFFVESRPLAEGARRRKAHFQSREEARQRLGSKPPFNGWTAETFDTYMAHGFTEGPDGSVQLKCPGPIEAHFYEAGDTEDALHRLDELAVPALFISGTKSYMLAHVREQQRRAPQSRLELMEGTGHFVPQERPAETAALLNAWFA